MRMAPASGVGLLPIPTRGRAPLQRRPAFVRLLPRRCGVSTENMTHFNAVEGRLATLQVPGGSTTITKYLSTMRAIFSLSTAYTVVHEIGPMGMTTARLMPV
jgi:hypothetical protein